MMQAYSVRIHTTVDEERKKRNRIAKRKSRQRQGQQVVANDMQEGLGQITFSPDTVLPILTPTQFPHNKDVESVEEGYVMDPALSELGVLGCFGYSSEEPFTEIGGGSIDPQLDNHKEAQGSREPRDDTESAISRWNISTSELQFQPPQKQEQRNYPPRREPALHRAVITGNEDIVKVLLQHQAEVNSRDKNGRTALDLAIDVGNVTIVQILLEHGADIEGN